ncbi:DegT/DnrJ/EryC1/StrS family aminotransferase [Pseudotamlana carrageenivorans]|uniref:L-glutamine--2-deoxy-scyllo-inosose aminotransferase KanB n=1 Tax=Pseudotamlana carrageenivorans TaxID=2069432 RepID=A0A2I7SMP7_9FLAO|nr:DegT/DnrJ/EryC1/StrS family aminotransferase [Tamlana carrageenivorans]AUS07171.1 L-glutamine--2-deoxy-scyllo-inosose aminotransferase KanB [Tamlana carrageenivorans]
MPGFELFGDLERKEVNDVLDNGVLMRYGFDGMRNGHWKAKELETALQTTLQTNHVQLVSSGTAALSVALASAGIGAGDEVILPTFTFVASFEAVMQVGATPVLVDIDDTLGLDPKAIKKALTPNTKCIMVVQMCGGMAHMQAILDICKTNNLILIEDACQAIGATFNNKPLGSIGDLGCFSFDFVKTITCGEGGAVITNNEDYYVNADHYSDHGHDHVGNDRGAETHPFLGYNYRISELHAAVGLAQVKRLPEILNIQERNFNIIKEALKSVSGLTFRTVPQGGVENYSFLSFFLKDLETTQKAMALFKENGIDGCFHYFDNNWHYVRRWQHLTQQKSLFPLSQEIKNGLQELENKTFEASDAIIARNISCLIKLSWTEEEVKARAQKMAELLGSL